MGKIIWHGCTTEFQGEIKLPMIKREQLKSFWEDMSWLHQDNVSKGADEKVLALTLAPEWKSREVPCEKECLCPEIHENVM